MTWKVWTNGIGIPDRLAIFELWICNDGFDLLPFDINIPFVFLELIYYETATFLAWLSHDS